MPCYADTVVKVKYVRKTEKDDSNLTVFWAVGVYPVEREDHEIEMVLSVPANLDERFGNQSVFEKDGFYSVDGKVVPGITK